MDTLFDTLSYSVESGVGYVRLTRPDNANAMGHAFARDLRDAMFAIEHDPGVRAAVVTAEGPLFCGGGDLKEFASFGDDLPRHASHLVTDLHAALYAMNRIAKPIVAGVRGSVGGAGLSLVAAFDLVIAAESAKFTLGYTKIAMTPDGTSTYFLARHIGLRRAMDMVLTNRVLTARDACDWGLVNDVVADDHVDDAAMSLAQTFAAGPARALGVAKRLVYEGYESSLEQAGEREATEIVTSMSTADGREGIAAFTEKRPPTYGGH